MGWVEPVGGAFVWHEQDPQWVTVRKRRTVLQRGVYTSLPRSHATFDCYSRKLLVGVGTEEFDGLPPL